MTACSSHSLFTIHDSLLFGYLLFTIYDLLWSYFWSLSRRFCNSSEKPDAKIPAGKANKPLPRNAMIPPIIFGTGRHLPQPGP